MPNRRKRLETSNSYGFPFGGSAMYWASKAGFLQATVAFGPGPPGTCAESLASYLQDTVRPQKGGVNNPMTGATGMPPPARAADLTRSIVAALKRAA